MTRNAIGAAIVGCLGLELSADERAFYNRTNPWGLILFKRNCESPEQVKALTQSFRDATGRKDAPVFIDQEGGRVQRMGPPVAQWRKYPPAAAFGHLYNQAPALALRAARNVGLLMAKDLIDVGVTANCIPVLDLPQPGASTIINDRAYHTRPEPALMLARAHMAGFIDGGVMPVMKHIPGHGRAEVDSHLELPVIKAKREALEAHDFVPFAGLAECAMAMTAHVVLTAIDAKNPATQSRKVIRDIIRKQLAFNGLLMTDDLSMKALKGTFTEKVEASLSAGVDMLLHCNGEMAEMAEVVAAAGMLKGKALNRAKAALKTRRKPQKFDEKAALADLQTVFEAIPTS
jgi:beta-N-acetylhexosaminidase